MELNEHDIGKYYLVCDSWETLGIETICKFKGINKTCYPYVMYSIKGHWEGRLDTFSKREIVRELSESEALTLAL